MVFARESNRIVHDGKKQMTTCSRDQWPGEIYLCILWLTEWDISTHSLKEWNGTPELF